MFTFKKTPDNEPNVDKDHPYLTAELHYAHETKCAVYSKEFVDGDRCGILETGGGYHIAHEECPQ